MGASTASRKLTFLNAPLAQSRFQLDFLLVGVNKYFSFLIL